MNIKSTLICLALATASTIAAQQINPITRAVLDGYQEILKENPNDYITLYQRGAQYYNLSLYDDARSDIARAIDNTPAKEKEYLLQEYNLLADISIEQKRYEDALNAINKVLEFDPQSYSALYKKGNIHLYLNQPQDAYRAFSSMQRLKSRSQEAYFGMAKALIMSGETDEVPDLIKEAEAAAPNDYVTYCRVGDLYRDLGDNSNAAGAYLSAFSLTTDSPRPMQSLLDLAYTDYPSVAGAIDYSLTLTTNTLPLNFLKGNIALETGNYASAYDAFADLLQVPDAQIAPVYLQQARAALALNRVEDALEAANSAINNGPSAEGYTLRSEINLAAGHPANALLDASKAVKADPNSQDALVRMALANIALKDNKAALDALNEAVILNAENVLPLILRAYINNESGNAKQAVADYQRVIVAAGDDVDSQIFKGIAQARNGKKMDADATVEKALNNDSSNDALIAAAIYYAQTGGLDKAQELVNRAVASGYGNKYRLQTESLPGLDLAPIRYLLK